MEELRAYCDIPDNIDLRLMEESDESTLGGEHNAVFFTREHLAIGLRFPVPSIVKQFLHFYQGAVGPRPSQYYSDSNRMQCVERLIPTRPFVG